MHSRRKHESRTFLSEIPPISDIEQLAPQKRNWKQLYLRIFKAVIVVLVIVGIVYAGWKAVREFDRNEFDWRQVKPLWIVASCLFYFAAMCSAWVYWQSLLLAMGQRPTVWQSVNAFFLGQLGKYVPGKGMVVVIRAGLIKSHAVDASVAALSVFVETLTMMAVGGFLAAAILIFIAREQTGLVLLAVGLMFCAGVPTIPPLFRRVVRMLKVTRISDKVDAAIDRLTYGVILKGWLISLVTWTMFGLSLYAVLKSLPGPQPEESDILLCIGCSALATVAGFLSLIPGGLGVRELVLLPLLGPEYGATKAAIAAVLLRFVWLVTELLVSFILYLQQRFRAPRTED